MSVNRKLFTPLKSLYFTQFLSSFADNLNFFIIVGMVNRQGFVNPDSYMTKIQIGFLLAYVVLAPIVGTYADKNAKSFVLLVGNLFKSIGIGLLLLGLPPIICYTILGIGAVIYSPAKYGILSELTSTEDQLLRANAMIEGSAIIAIGLGTLAGGILADKSDFPGIITCLIFYLTSLAFTFFIPKIPGNRKVHYIQSTKDYFNDLLRLISNRKARFSLLGTSSFWLTTAVLRIALIAWIPANLGIHSTKEQSLILGVTAVGVVVASVFTARLVPAGKLYNAYYYGFLMVLAIVLAAFVPHLIFTVIMLLLMGFFGGVFLIPLNTLLQEVGKDLVGSGKTIAIQNFVENTLTVIGLLIYIILTYYKVPINLSVVIIGSILLLFVLYLSTQAEKVKRDINAG
jgi:LPLT family lysophospholipid transporter-like MFS transporter